MNFTAMGNAIMEHVNDSSIRIVMSNNEIDLYKSYLSNAAYVLEYGIGGSTVLAAESGISSLYSIDTDANWINKIAKQSAVANMISEGKARLIYQNIGSIGNWGKPANASRFYLWPHFARRPWRDGVKPDLALVDGRFRVSCILQCFLNGGPELKVAVHDFWNRRQYHNVLRFADVIERADKMAILKAKPDCTKWLAAIRRLRHMYDSR